MAKIVISGNNSKIVDEGDFEFLSRLDKHLSFKYVGAEYTPAFRAHRWDGKEYLLSKKLEFMTGLVKYVLDFYSLNGKEIEIVDNRKLFVPGIEIDLTDNLKKLNIEPYDYQLDAISKAVKNDRMIFKHATGSGKSLTAALITAKFGKATAIYVVSKDLLYQFHSFFSSLFSEKIGIVGDGLCDIQRISIVSIQTVGRTLGMKKNEILLDEDGSEKFNENDKVNIINYIKSVNVHMFDECHCSAAKTTRNIYKIINPEKVYGFSGTPTRDDGSDLLITGIFGNIVDEITASNLIKRNILSKPFIKFNYIKGSSKFTDTYLTVYSNNIVNNFYRNNMIISETTKLIDKGYQVLVLFKTIKHGKILLDLFKLKNIHCEFLTGNDSAEKRELAKNNLLSKKSICILASMIYDIGISIETLNGLVLAGGGKSSIKTLQRIGRVLRDGKNKPFVAVVDFWDDVIMLKKHSKIRKQIYETESEFIIKMPKEVNEK